jgi:hypothetical protein
MALLQTLGAFVQTMAVGNQFPKPYTVGPFAQPMTEEIVVPPQVGGGQFVSPPVCPPGTYWDPIRRCCVPYVEEPKLEDNPLIEALADELFDDTQSVVEPPELPEYIARATAAAIALTINTPKNYELLSAQIGLILQPKD